MWKMEVETVLGISSHLCVSCGKAEVCKKAGVVQIEENGVIIKGLPSSIKYLVRKCGATHLLGKNGEDRALVDQWLEYRVTVVDRLTSKADRLVALRELDNYLRDKVYLVGFYPTVADYVMFYGLHHCFNNSLSFQEKQSIIHISRWFNQVQSSNGLRRKLDKVIFQKNLIYTKYTH